ncbi:MAG: hypothetical protein JWN48_3530 [Myxococcaceae bacterium]|nr:hypothetical protein [Myxococcaceae bacterium]
MRLFTCSACQQLVFFDNVRCTSCSHALGYLPDHRILSAIEPFDGNGKLSTETLYVALSPAAAGSFYRLCRNDVQYAACSWLLCADDPHELCESCRLNELIPDLSRPDAMESWHKVERAKRRLLYTLSELRLPVESREQRPEGGLAFAFLADGDHGHDKVLTGHANGLITINIAEADHPFREQMRQEMGEAYRTLLGHFRHEVGHYYWDRLIGSSRWLPHFRALFGDERLDYAAALQHHYEQGAPAGWGKSFVSAYATMHPWEDWAETWAHYLHMVDTLGTARAYGVVLRPKPVDGKREQAVSTRKLDFEDFDSLVAGWIALTVALNSLNRSMGQFDPYPFVLKEQAIHKLRFVHELLEHWQDDEATLDEVLERWPASSPVDPPPKNPNWEQSSELSASVEDQVDNAVQQQDEPLEIVQPERESTVPESAPERR